MFCIANLDFRLTWLPIKFSDFDKIDAFGRGLFKEHFCEIFVQIPAVK